MAFLKRAPIFMSRARFAFYTVLLSLAVGCGRHERPADVTIINGGEPDSLDPAIVSGQVGMRVAIGLFEGLTRFDARTGRPVPGLAERWEISPDGLVYTFHLRTNLLWSTGEPITADDIVFSWDRALNPATAADYASQIFCVKNAKEFNAGRIKDPSLVGIHAVDPATVRIELDQPTSFFLDVCAMRVTATVPRQAIQKHGDHWLTFHPLPASGPYELVYWRLNDKIRLKKNTNYWDAANTRSDIIDLLPVGSPNPALNLYERGEADIVWDKDLIPQQLIDILVNRPDFHSFNYLGTYFIRFNVTKKPFDDPRVRRALALATDKERIVKKITRAGEQVAGSLVPPGTADYTSPPGLPYDPAQARQLLADAGYPGGQGFPHIEFTFSASGGGGDKIHENIGIELKQMWHDQLGVELDLRQLEAKIFYSAQSHLDYQLSRSSWIGDYDDANTFLGMFTSDDGNNRTGWKNPQYDGLITEANRQTDPHRRETLLQQAETLLIHDEAPIIPLYFYVGMNYFDTNKVQGVYQNVLDEHPLQTIWRIGREPRGEGREH